MMEASGLDVTDPVEADFTAAGGALATERLLDRPTAPTAILYSNDLMAMAGMAVANRRGIAVPGDLSIVGYDDAELAAYLHPPLSTIRTDAYRWGRAAATHLDRVARRSATRRRPSRAGEIYRPRFYRPVPGTSTDHHP